MKKYSVNEEIKQINLFDERFYLITCEQYPDGKDIFNVTGWLEAFPKGMGGSINIMVKPKAGIKNEIDLEISDDGVGIPANLDLKTSKSLGLHLVNILVTNQLQGQIKLDRGAGTKFQITFSGVD